MRAYLRKLRTDRGLSMQAAADAIGISKQYLGMIETGQRQRKIDLTLAAQIAEYYEVSLEYILHEESELFKSEAAATAKEESA